MKRFYKIVLGTIAAICLHGPAQSQEVKPKKLILETYSESFQSVIRKKNEEFGVIHMDAITKAIMDKLNAWPSTSMPLAVCFLDGGIKARKKVVKAASAWELSGSSISFDFGHNLAPRDCNGGQYQIRISFKGTGVSSFVGTDSENRIPAYQASMVLGGFDIAPPADEEFNRWVVHEFGHALGFVHEHQGKEINCEREFDFDKLYEELGEKPYFWEEEDVDRNMRQLTLLQSVSSDFDPESIMLYTFEPRFYLRGSDSPCFHEANYELSKVDVSFAISYFPKVHPDEKENLLSERQSLEQLFSQKIQASNMNETLKEQAIGQIHTLTPQTKLPADL